MKLYPVVSEMLPGQAFRMDYDGRAGGMAVRYAGETYTMLADGRVRASDGRIWPLQDCGLTADTAIKGPVWGAATA